MPDPQAQPAIDLMELESLVERTEVRDIRLQRFSGEVLRTPPESVDVRLTNSLPRYALQEGSILALFTHRLDFEELSEQNADEQPVGHVEVTHIVELELRGEGEPSDDSVSALLATNVLFMVYPYVRAALQRLPVEFGLPPILLPYLRRDVSSPLHGELTPSDADD